MPLEVNLSQGEQMEYVGQAVHQLVRENYLQRTVFQGFGQTLLEVTQAVKTYLGWHQLDTPPLSIHARC